MVPILRKPNGIISKQLLTTCKGYDAAILSSRKDGITNSTDSESIISESDSPTTINLLLKVHQYEMVNLYFMNSKGALTRPLFLRRYGDAEIRRYGDNEKPIHTAPFYLRISVSP